MKDRVRNHEPKNYNQEKTFIKAKSCMNYVHFSDSLFYSKEPRDDREDAIRNLEKKINKDFCKKLINDIDKRDKTILEMRFGLNGYHEHTLQETGNKLGIS